MSPKTKERIHWVYGIVLAVLIVAVGACFALSCLSIYKSGSSPFTRESIAIHFDRIAIPVYICIAGMGGGIVLSLALPLEGGKIKPRREGSVVLEKLSAKLDLMACELSVQNGIRKERTFRCVTRIVAAVISVLALIPAFVWCVNPAHFTIENLSDDIKTAAAVLLPCAVVALGAWIFVVLLHGGSVARETALIKSALSENRQISDKSAEKSNPHKKHLTADPRFVWAVRGVLLVVGIVFVVLGVLNGGMADVLGKAIRICTECIGLG